MVTDGRPKAGVSQDAWAEDTHFTIFRNLNANAIRKLSEIYVIEISNGKLASGYANVPSRRAGQSQATDPKNCVILHLEEWLRDRGASGFIADDHRILIDTLPCFIGRTQYGDGLVV